MASLTAQVIASFLVSVFLIIFFKLSFEIVAIIILTAAMLKEVYNKITLVNGNYKNILALMAGFGLSVFVFKVVLPSLLR